MNLDADIAGYARAEIAAMAEKYLWWGGGSALPHSPARMVAQIMNLGTYEDILRLEQLLAAEVLASVLAQAEPGWFSRRSWEFWKGRLGADLPDRPPVRAFA